MDKKRKTVRWNTETFNNKIQDIYKGSISLLEPYCGIDNKILCKCEKHNVEWKARPSTLLKGKCNCPICLQELKELRHQEQKKKFLDKVAINNPNIEVLGEYIDISTPIKVKCKIDGYIWYANPSHLSSEKEPRKCPFCSNKVVIEGINDIATTHKEKIKYFKNQDDAKKYSYGSNQKTIFVCPDCGYEKEYFISDFIKNGFKCNICSDSISYPNKFFRRFLSCLPIENWKTEWSPKWAKGMYYDNYFEYNGKKFIVEADGEFHYENKFSSENLRAVQYRDALKDFLANENNIAVIRIDCRNTKTDSLVKNIYNSELSILFDLSNIDWDECASLACKNIYKEIALFFNENPSLSVNELSEHFHISKYIVRKSLNIGNKCNWCVYNKKIGMLNSKSPNRHWNVHHITVLNMDDVPIYHFRTPTICKNYMSKWYGKNFDAHHIVEVCKGIRQTHCGFKYKFCEHYDSINDYIEINEINYR